MIGMRVLALALLATAPPPPQPVTIADYLRGLGWRVGKRAEPLTGEDLEKALEAFTAAIQSTDLRDLASKPDVIRGLLSDVEISPP